MLADTCTQPRCSALLVLLGRHGPRHYCLLAVMWTDMRRVWPSSHGGDPTCWPTCLLVPHTACSRPSQAPRQLQETWQPPPRSLLQLQQVMPHVWPMPSGCTASWAYAGGCQCASARPAGPRLVPMEWEATTASQQHNRYAGPGIVWLQKRQPGLSKNHLWTTVVGPCMLLRFRQSMWPPTGKRGTPGVFTWGSWSGSPCA